MYVFNLELILCSVRQGSNSVSSVPLSYGQLISSICGKAPSQSTCSLVKFPFLLSLFQCSLFCPVGLFVYPCTNTTVFFYYLKKYLFICLYWILVAAHRRIFNCTIEHLVSTCGIQFPDQGLNQAPCIGSMQSQPLDHQGSPYSVLIIIVL